MDIQQQFPHENPPQSPRQLRVLLRSVRTGRTPCHEKVINGHHTLHGRDNHHEHHYAPCLFGSKTRYRRAYQLTVGREAGGAATVLSATGRAAGRANKAVAERATSILREAFMAEFMVPAVLIFPRCCL